MPPRTRFPEFPTHANVPIVGAAFEVGEATMCVVARCHCKPENKPFLIPSVDAAKICSECGNVFVIAETRYQRGRTHGLNVTVAIVGNRKDMVDQARAQALAAARSQP